MGNATLDALKTRFCQGSFEKLARINNPKVHDFVARYVELCNPASIFVSADTPEDLAYFRKKAVEQGEELPLALEGHTIHFDAYGDQGRDKDHTNILVPPGVDLGESISTRDRHQGLTEVHDILKDMMKGREMYVCFYCLGPTNSVFSMPCVQLTDSSYVAHSETLLYRAGYQEFVRQGQNDAFYRFVHSQGEVDERKVSRNLDKRRIYIDIEDNVVFSTNTQYGGNTIGLKKLAMRLAIKQASAEGWLTEHMLVMGIHNPQGRVTYFTGAFPSLCGKTSTAMLDGESIVGDDIAYLRVKNGKVWAVNVEKGMFGIIQGINSKDDPLQWKALHNPGEIIVSNILMTQDGQVHWIGRDGEVPEKGKNHSGDWFKGKKDGAGKEIPCSHPNARFTLSLSLLDNLDPNLDNPEGVEVGGVVYGGRDSDTCPPVEEAFDWVHGIITKGASLESETTAATLGKEGVREFNPMSNLDFLSIPIGRYIEDNLRLIERVNKPPQVFSVNYFLTDTDGRFLNEKNDKKVWYKWMEQRVHNEVQAFTTPTGNRPLYEDLAPLFKTILGQTYTREAYDKQFMVRIPEGLSKLDRIEAIYRTKVTDTPQVLFTVLEEQRKRLKEIQARYGDYIKPEVLIKA